MISFHNKDISGSSFLVTGGAGFIGSHIVEYLLNNSQDLIIVCDIDQNGLQNLSSRMCIVINKNF